MKEDFLKKIRSAFDLNIYEVRIWTALLSRGIATAGELADIGNVPRSRSYDILESLEKKGFIIMKIGKPIKYIAVKPEEIIKRIKNNIVIKTNTKLEDIDKVRDEEIFKEMELLYKQGIEHVDPLLLSGLFKNRNNVYNQIQTMIEQAKKSIIISTTETGLTRKIDQFKSTFRKLTQKGVKIRIAAPINEKVKKDLKDVPAEIKDINLNSRFVVVDSKEIIFMISDDQKIHENYDIGIWVNTPFFANSLENLFNNAWRSVK